MQGMKTGGRTRGTRNRASKAREEAIAASGLTPLDHLLSVMRDPSRSVPERLEAAKAAAPFVHPKLSAVTVKAAMNVQRIERVIIDPKAQDTTTRTTDHGDRAQNRLQ